MMYSSAYKKPNRSIKNKNQKINILLMQLFDFTYAGKAHIFITKQYDNFVVVAQGVHFVEDIFTFSPNYFHRFNFETLYQAIDCYNKCVREITSSMDWFSPDMFDDPYKEIFITE